MSSSKTRSFVLNELCDKVGTQDLGTSINNISAYLETRVVMLRNVKVCIQLCDKKTGVHGMSDHLPPPPGNRT